MEAFEFWITRKISDNFQLRPALHNICERAKARVVKDQQMDMRQILHQRPLLHTSWVYDTGAHNADHEPAQPGTGHPGRDSVMPRTIKDRDPIREKDVRPIASVPHWHRQYRMWAKLFKDRMPSQKVRDAPIFPHSTLRSSFLYRTSSSPKTPYPRKPPSFLTFHLTTERLVL